MTFLSPHLAHLLGVTVILTAAATWTAAMVIKWAGDAVDEHVDRALDTWDRRVDAQLGFCTPDEPTPIYAALKTHYAQVEIEAAAHADEVVAEAEALLNGGAA